MNRAANILRKAWDLMGCSPFTVSHRGAAEDYRLVVVGDEDSDPETPPGCVLVGRAGAVSATEIRRAVSQGGTR